MLMPGWIRNTLAKLLWSKHPAAPVPGARLVDPRVTQDAEHPRREGRVRPKLIRTRQRPLDRNLNKIIRILHASRKSAGKPPQTRQQRNNLLAKVVNHYLHVASGPAVKMACILLIITARAADAQIGVPNVRLPALPQPQLQGLENTLSGTVGQVEGGALQDVRRLRLQDLVRRNRAVLDVDPNGAPIVRGEVIAVSPADAEVDAAVAAGFAVLRIRVLDGLDARVVVLAPPKGMNTQRALRKLRELLPAASLDFNHIYTDSGSNANDPPAVASSAQALPPSAPSAQPAESVMTERGMKLGLIDGGVDVTHAVFKDAKIHQHGCAGASIPSPHGTAVASLLVGQSEQFRGAAAGSELYAVDVFCGLPTGGAADAVADAFAWLAREHVAVVNVSLVGPPNATLEAVVRLVVGRGHLVVAAVGNDGPAAKPLYPASYPGVVGVTGVDTRHRVLIEACRGPQVKFAAPGADMSAAKSAQTFELVRGTSYAAPFVAGLLSASLHEPDKEAAARAVEDLAHRAVDLGAAGIDPVYGYGLVGADLAPQTRLAGAHAH
jgi:subtilisin family serine protease